jgi:hypothetical protein
MVDSAGKMLVIEQRWRLDVVHVIAGVLLLCTGWTAFAWTDHSILITIDAAEQTYPWWLFGIRELQAFRFPFWDPYISGGMTAVGDAVRGFFYPPFLLFSLAGPYALTTKAIYGFALLHFLIAFAGAYVLARSLRLSAHAALVTGLVYSLGGFLTRRAGGQLCIFDGDAWIPWAIAGLVLAMTRRAYAWAVLAGACMGMSVLAGHFQPAIDGSLIIAAVLVSSVFAGRDNETVISRARRAAAVGMIALASAAAVSAVQLVASAEYFPGAFRWLGAIEADTGLSYGLASSRTPWEVIAANPSLPLTGLLGVALKVGSYTFKDASIYTGSAALLLVLIGLRCSESRTRLLWGGLIALGIVLAAGNAIPLLKVMYSFVPLIDKVREPVRHLLLTHTAAAVSAGYGIDALMRRDKRARFVAMVLIPVYGAIVALAIRFNSPNPPPNAIVLGAIATLAAVMLVLTGIRTERASRLSVAAFAALITAELYVGWIAFMPTRSRFDGAFNRAVEFHYSTPLATQVTEFLQTRPGIYRVDISTRVGPDNVIAFGSLVPDNLGELARFLGTAGYCATKPAPFITLGTWLGSHPPSTGARLLGVRYLITSVPQTGLIEVAELGKLRVYEDPLRLPVARFVDHVEFSRSDGETLERIRENGARTGVAVVPERQRQFVEPSLRGTVKSGRPPAAQVTEYLPSTVRVVADTDVARLLATADPYFIGWRAFIDGRPAPLIRTDYAFRGVVVPAGRHIVTFRYAPWRIYRGAAISAVAMLMTAFIAFRHFRGFALDATVSQP